jgi:hypothetical protein
MPQSDITSEASDAAVSTAFAGAQTEEPSQVQKSFILGLVCSSHTLNHIQSGVTSVLFPVMMKELGFGYLQRSLALVTFSSVSSPRRTTLLLKAFR